MSRKTELAKNTAILTVGRLCTQCISFFLLPLYTAILSTEEYGTFDLLVTYSTLLLPLVNWQLDQGLFRFMLDYSKDVISMNSAPLARGEKVRVIKGPLTGLVGELVTVDGKSKIAVRLNMLGCACADMPVGYVEPVRF